ncbi:MAG: SurA N-terminal domain-containing protein [Syntrophales bacterium]|nr:SurA N-terminal domain-containing protein [Syntrophales bacterium]
MKKFDMKILVFLAACLASWFGAAPVKAEIVDRIVAVVNDDIITMSELNQMSRMFQSRQKLDPKGKERQALKREMLEALIDRKLAKAEAKRRGIAISDKELDAAVEDFKKKNRIPDDATLTKDLAQHGMTLKELRQQLADQIQQERLVFIAVGAKKSSVSEKEVRHYYETHFQKSSGKQVHLRMINLPYPPGATPGQKEEILKKAEGALKDIRLGGSLAEVLQKYSLTSQDMGFINQADLNPQLGELISKLRPGEVAPIQTPAGFQMMILVGRRSGTPPSFEEVAPQIRRMLEGLAMQKEFAQWVKTLRAKAHIKIML